MFCGYGVTPYAEWSSGYGNTSSYFRYQNFAGGYAESSPAVGFCSKQSCAWLSIGPRKYDYKPVWFRFYGTFWAVLASTFCI